MIIKVITVNKNHFIHSPSLFNSSVKYLLLLLNFFILLNIPFIISSFLFTNNKKYTDIFIEMKLEDSELEILTDKLNKLD